MSEELSAVFDNISPTVLMVFESSTTYYKDVAVIAGWWLSAESPLIYL